MQKCKIAHFSEGGKTKTKTQEQVLKLFSACVVITSIQRNEHNTKFKH